MSIFAVKSFTLRKSLFMGNTPTISTPITSLEALAHRAASTCRAEVRVAAVCPTDSSSQAALFKAANEGIARPLCFGGGEVVEKFCQNIDGAEYSPAPTPAEAAREAVAAVRRGEADIPMKGLVETADLLRAVLDKEQGLLPQGGVLLHIAVAEMGTYGKLLFFTDSAVIPYPTFEQRRAQVNEITALCRAFGITEPKVSLIHCSEHASSKFPHTLEYATLVNEAREGRFGKGVILDGPLDVRTSCDAAAMKVKGIDSAIDGQADALVFPDIEAANVFYKTVTFFAKASTAGMLCGTSKPVVLPSRGDSAETKFYSLAMAALKCTAGKEQ